MIDIIIRNLHYWEAEDVIQADNKCSEYRINKRVMIYIEKLYLNILVFVNIRVLTSYQTKPFCYKLLSDILHKFEDKKKFLMYKYSHKKKTLLKFFSLHRTVSVFGILSVFD